MSYLSKNYFAQLYSFVTLSESFIHFPRIRFLIWHGDYLDLQKLRFWNPTEINKS